MLSIKSKPSSGYNASNQPFNNGAQVITLRQIGGNTYDAHDSPRVRRIRLPCTVGRQHQSSPMPATSNAIFTSDFLSRKHAEFFSDPNGKVYLKDLNSSNGTFLNGNQLKPMKPVILQENDIVQFGSEDEESLKESIVVVQLSLLNNSTGSSLSNMSYRASSSSNESINNDDPHPSSLNQKTRRQEANLLLQSKLTEVMKKMSSLGMQMTSMRNGPEGRQEERILQMLDYVEGAVGALISDGDMAQVMRPFESEDYDPSLSNDTIHTRPTLKSALRIIAVYETVFLILTLIATFLIMQRK